MNSTYWKSLLAAAIGGAATATAQSSQQGASLKTTGITAAAGAIATALAYLLQSPLKPAAPAAPPAEAPKQ